MCSYGLFHILYLFNIHLVTIIIHNLCRQILQMSNTSNKIFRNIKIFVNYVSKYYNGTPSVRNRYSHFTQLDMTCPREDIPHLQWQEMCSQNCAFVELLMIESEFEVWYYVLYGNAHNFVLFHSFLHFILD